MDGFHLEQELLPGSEALPSMDRRESPEDLFQSPPRFRYSAARGAYREMARAMGIDPRPGNIFPSTSSTRNSQRTTFTRLLHPMERDGVDFWWLDWQQWSTTSIPGVNPTFYLNYVHYTDMERQGRNRPLIYHRWGGLGNHRYQIGFSGDTRISWELLGFSTLLHDNGSQRWIRLLGKRCRWVFRGSEHT